MPDVRFVPAAMKAAVFLLPLLLAASSLGESKPNVILFLVDDMGWMDSTPYGSRYYETPNMERLAKQSMRFTQAYSLPLCSPTRASLLTGQHTSRHGITSATGHQQPQAADHKFLPESGPANKAMLMPESKNYLDPSQHTLAEALRDAGYRTGHFGKWHLGLTRPHWPEAQGFDVAWHCHPDPGPPGEYFSPYGVGGDGEPKGKTKTGTITDGPAGEYITDRLTDEALRFIESSKGGPFFLNLWQYGVHGPWGHKESHTAEFAKKTDPTGRQGNPVMASMLKSVDESLGRILDKLDELGLAENTIVIFTSDNGGNIHSNTEQDGKQGKKEKQTPAMASYRKWAGFKPPTSNSPLRDGKGRLYEGGIRVPLMVRWPGKIAAGSTSDAVAGCIDVYPTVLELAGIAANPKQKIDGVSYAPVLTGTGPLKRAAYFTWFPHLVPGVAVRAGDWKLIRRFEERPDDYEGLHELFNLKEDLGETKNLAKQMPDKVKELDAMIDAFAADTGALMPKPNPAFKPRAAGTSTAGSLEAMTRGLVPRDCKLAAIAGAVRMEATGRKPFLGTAQIKSTGPLTVQLRLRTKAGGQGMIQWKTSEQADFPKNGQTANFTVPASGEFQDVTVEAPVEGRAAIVRVHLPAAQEPVDVQSIRFSSASGKPKVWDFSGMKP